jgi:cyclophilin family peptidyl-prolyl cis-trans isomerase
MNDTRKTILYLFGILGLILLVFFIITRFSSVGFGVLKTDAGKTYDQAPSNVLEDGVDYQAVIKTNMGDIKYDLLEENAPVTVNNFVFLAKDNFYDEVEFHRVVKDFIIQSGSRLTLDNNPQNDGVGGPGYKFDDEINWESINLPEEVTKVLEQEGYASDTEVKSVPITQYSLAMANAGPNTNGSQFFIVTGEKDSENVKALRGKHTVFGQLISGKEVIEKINGAAVEDPNSMSPRPIEDIVILDVEIIEK